MAKTEPDNDLEALLEYLRDARGFDFTGYKRASLSRRITHRMGLVDAQDYSSYMAMLEANPGEFAELFDTILINVTSFLRDPESWDFLAAEIVPSILEGKGSEDVIRLWSAGTASGQEAYSLAALLVEALGEDRFRSSVKIYATDVDEAALMEARHARYPTAAVVSTFGEERAARFFDTEGTTSVFRQDLRRSLIFGRHDLVQHPPISRIDLLVCRNTLMYFTAEIQRQVLQSFHFALADRGYLFLGRSDAMVTRSPLYEVVDLKHRVFRRAAGGGGVPRPPLPDLRTQLRPTPADPSTVDVVRTAFEESPVAQLVIDPDGTVAAVNRRARSLFGLGLDAAGKALKDLEVSYHPLELRSIMDDVTTNRRPAVVHDVEWTTPIGELEYLDVNLLPLGPDGRSGVSITFSQVGRYKHLRDELERSQRELETAYEELQSTVEELETTNEELETTNEELQSTNEELETANEELHSANEELETMNEELQSTNEELETANGELRERGLALDDLNSFLESILASLKTGIVVLTRDMAVRSWNRAAEDMWGLRADEVEGSHFLNLDVGFPIDQLRAPIRACLSGTSESEELHLPAVNRRGRSVEVAVRMSPLRDGREIIGAILVMEA